MYTEMGFLFESSDKIKNRYNFSESIASKDGELPKSTQTKKEDIEFDEDKNSFVFNKYVIKKEDNNNYIKSTVNAAYQTKGRNPYLQLLDDFEKKGEGLKIKPSDFAYLRDIGVYPINRLMILRRFPEGTTVPVDLNLLQDSKPISIVIGWIKEESELLEFSFNENWKTHNDRLDQLLGKIIQEQFGVDLGKLLPVPGWGEGFMFGLYNKLGLTSYSNTEIPVGDPDLLKESITRDIESQGILSNISFKLETVYEQKYIGGIDQTVAFMDILTNLLTMGTSDMKFLGKLGNKYVEMLKTANNKPVEPDAWAALIVSIVTDVVNLFQTDLLGKKSTEIDDFAKANEPKLPSVNTGTNENSDTGEKATATDKGAADGAKKSGAIVNIVNSYKNIIRSVLASTVARYQWPIRGAIAQMTGESSTPWHLTIGNPYAPLLSMNNIVVKKVIVKLGNEMSVNDIPKYMNVTIDIEQGRNLGKQEILKLIGVEYQRKYKKI